MTDEQKKLKEHFLEPETRCGYYVSAKTKACWKVMLDMLEEVDRICRKHDIKYFLIAGSLLGAIRHKGFIPWDDDVDIALFREDFDKLEKILPKELPPNMFMQTLGTDSEYWSAHMKIRTDGTAAMQKTFVNWRSSFHMGIPIDVFALDGVPKKQWVRRFQTHLAMRWQDFVRFRNATCLTRKREYVKKFLFSTIWLLFGNKTIHRMREWTFARFRIKHSDECVQLPCQWGYNHRYRYPVRLLLGPTTEVPFEYLTVKVPAMHDEVLTATYGDWRKIVKGDSVHEFVAISATEDYREIMAKKLDYPVWRIPKR